jgi:hypothetical protein
MFQGDQEKRLYWEKQMIDWDQSGMTRAQWCTKKDIKCHLFDYWKSRLYGKREKPQNNPQFVELKEESLPDAGLTVIVNGIQLCLQRNFDELSFKSALQCLKSIS